MADPKNPQQGGTQGGQQQGTDRAQPTYREQRQGTNTPRPGETQEQADERVRREQQSGGGSDNT
jgi:hypothetical protein